MGSLPVRERRFAEARRKPASSWVAERRGWYCNGSLVRGMLFRESIGTDELLWWLQAEQLAVVGQDVPIRGDVPPLANSGMSLLEP